MAEVDTSVALGIAKTVASALIAGGVAYGVVTSRLDHLEQGNDDIRELITLNQKSIWAEGEARDKRFEVVTTGLKERMEDWIRRVERLESYKHSGIDGITLHYADIDIPMWQADKEPPKAKLYQEELDTLRAQIDAAIRRTSDKTLTVEEQEDLLRTIWDMQIYQQNLLTKQDWCDLDESTRAQCWMEILNKRQTKSGN